MPISDTSPAARTLQLEIERTTTGEQRLIMVLEMSRFARDLAAAGIRQQHPEWTPVQVARELLRLAFLPDPLPPGLPWLRSCEREQILWIIPISRSGSPSCSSKASGSTRSVQPIFERMELI